MKWILTPFLFNVSFSSYVLGTVHVEYLFGVLTVFYGTWFQKSSKKYIWNGKLSYMAEKTQRFNV